MDRIWEILRRSLESDRSRRHANIDQILDDETHHRLPALTLAQYVDSLAEVPLPTPAQTAHFVEYVSHAHSWYKHLPCNLPGEPFYFFIDKYAGWDRVIMPDGTQGFAERKEKGFHYSHIPTSEYRTRFGHLAYSCGSGTTVFLLGRGPVVLPRDGVAAVPGHDARMYGLPEEILEAGLTRLTSVIHTLSSQRMTRWTGLRDWPEESGGQAVLEKIVARSQAMREPAFQLERMDMDHEAVVARHQTNPRIRNYLSYVDPVLDELLAPERRRQYGEMMKAINRVCAVVDLQRERPTHPE